MIGDPQTPLLIPDSPPPPAPVAPDSPKPPAQEVVKKSKQQWTPEEDEALLQAHRAFGSNWDGVLKDEAFARASSGRRTASEIRYRCGVLTKPPKPKGAAAPKTTVVSPKLLLDCAVARVEVSAGLGCVARVDPHSGRVVYVVFDPSKENAPQGDPVHAWRNPENEVNLARTKKLVRASEEAFAQHSAQPFRLTLERCMQARPHVSRMRNVQEASVNASRSLTALASACAATLAYESPPKKKARRDVTPKTSPTGTIDTTVPPGDSPFSLGALFGSAVNSPHIP